MTFSVPRCEATGQTTAVWSKPRQRTTSLYCIHRWKPQTCLKSNTTDSWGGNYTQQGFISNSPTCVSGSLATSRSLSHKNSVCLYVCVCLHVEGRGVDWLNDSSQQCLLQTEYRALHKTKAWTTASWLGTTWHWTDSLVLGMAMNQPLTNMLAFHFFLLFRYKESFTLNESQQLKSSCDHQIQVKMSRFGPRRKTPPKLSSKAWDKKRTTDFNACRLPYRRHADI